MDGLIVGFWKDQQRRGLAENTLIRRDISLRAFAKWLTKPIEEVTADDIQRFLDERNLTPNSRYGWLSTLHVFFLWARRHGHLLDDPTETIDRPKMHRGVPRPMADADLAAALAGATARMRAWLLLATHQGLRCMEIAGLKRDDVLDALDPPMLRVYGKGGREELLPLHPAVLEGLRQAGLPRSGFLFTRPQGGKYPAAQVSREINEYLRRMGIDATAHQGRHWFGSRLYANTRDLRLTQEMLRHKDPKTTAVYTAFNKPDAVKAISALRLTTSEQRPLFGT